MISDDNMTLEQQQVRLFETFVVRILETHQAYNILLEAEEDTKILSKTASAFFRKLNDLFARDFFLEASKILERSSSHGHKNLTVSLFAEREDWNEEQKAQLKEYERKLHRFYCWIKYARDKIIGHNDLSTYEDELSGLGAFPEGLDVEFVQTLEEFYNYLHEISFGEIWGSFTPNGEKGSVHELVSSLYDALAFKSIVTSKDTPPELRSHLIRKKRWLELEQNSKPI